MDIKVTIQTKDEYKLSGEVFVPTGEYRVPDMGEAYVSARGVVSSRWRDNDTTAMHIILKKKKWRAASLNKYFYILNTHIKTAVEERSSTDNERYNCGNYFANEADAECTSNNIREVLNASNNN